MNKLPLFTYNGMRNDIFRKLYQIGAPKKSPQLSPHASPSRVAEGSSSPYQNPVTSPANNQLKFTTFIGETEIDAAQSKIKWSLLTTEVFDTETIVSFSRNFFVLPQLCLILRTLNYITI